MKAGFAKIDITPAIGGQKIGWIKPVPIEEIRDPLYARVAVFADGDSRVAFVQLDTLSIRWTQVDAIRKRVHAECGFPGEAIMVAATHNHSGPAVATVCDVQRDDLYVAEMTEKVVHALLEAVHGLEDAELGFAHRFEFGLSHNRRTVLRDGTTITHGQGFAHPLALYTEGPIDPEVAVLAARRPGGALLGAVVNFACHPVHHGGEPVVTAGFPGVLAGKMAVRGCPDLVFLNGACGNISPGNPALSPQPSMEDIGRRLAEQAFEAIETMTFSDGVPLAAVSATVELPYRDATEDQVKGKAHGAQRFVDPAAYDRAMPGLLKRIAERGTQPAEIQVLRVGDVTFTAIPAEFFVQPGFRIKEAAHPLHGLVVSHANGMVGYVPHGQAFDRGGYETTFGPAWRMAPEAADLLVACASELVKPLRADHAQVLLAEQAFRKPSFGIQLYTVRDLTDDLAFKDTLTRLAGLGFEAVEFAWKYGGMSPEDLARFLEQVGLGCCGMHLQLDELLDPGHQVYDYAAAVGTEFVTTSLASAVAKWPVLLPKLNEVGRICRDKGLRFTYHNHWQEFERIDGVYALDRLVEETDPALVELELDIGWVTKGGEEAMEYWRQHGSRIPQVHLRDYDVGADVDCDVGDGFIDMQAVLAQATELGTRWLIYEQSTYPVDSLSSCRVCGERYPR